MKAVIANIGPYEFFFSRSYGQFQILPCPKHMPYALTIITDRKDRLDMGEQQYMPIPVEGQDIARDLVENEMLAPHGVFVCAGERPTPEELERAEQVRREYYKRKLAEGDGLWAKYHRHELIDDNCKRAAIFLGESREWSGEVLAKIDCPGCGEKILASIARHNACGWVLDPDRAYSGGLIDAPTRDRLKKARKTMPAPAAADAEDEETAEEKAAKAAAQS